MADSPHHFAPLGPLSPDGRTHIGVEIRGSGLPALPVVMVWVPERITSSPEKLRELQEQTASALKLDHPHIIRVRGLEKLDEGWARVVEFADAEPLRKLLEAGRGRVDMLWPAIAAAIVADACLGVHHAHEVGEARDPKRPQLHGGIRPETLLVDYKGRTKVTGYGAAVFAPEEKNQARDAYTAPEQVLGGREAMTRQTDVYQLGAVLYECLTGVPPFTAEEGLLEQLILSKTPASHRLSEQPELGEIALKALSKKAIDRYPTAAAMHEALVAAKGSPPVSHEVVARWANILFPPTHPDRVTRREHIKNALATTGATEIPPDLAEALAEPPADPEAVTAQTTIPNSAPNPIPPPAPIPSSEGPAPAPAKPAPRPVAPAPVLPTGRPFQFTEPPPSHTGRNAVIGVVVVGAVVAWMYWVRKTEGPSPVGRAMIVAAESDSGQNTPPPPVAPVDSGATALAAATLPDGGAVAALSSDGGSVDGGTVLASAALADGGAIANSSSGGDSGSSSSLASGREDAGAPPSVPLSTRGTPDAGPKPPPPPASDKLVLEIETEPPMSVKIDGEKAGSGNFSKSLAPGKHHLEGSDKALHVFAARDVNLTKDHQSEKLAVGKAQLAFDVPPGATVEVDGKAIGTAPVQPVELFAGTHDAVVEFNGARTEQKVPITADFNVTLTVHANENQ